MSASAPFPFFRLDGLPDALGRRAGGLFGDKIRACIAFYKSLLADCSTPENTPTFETTLQRLCGIFARTLSAHFPDYAVEIRAMAEAAGVPEWEIYMINARTELFALLAAPHRAEAQECTSLALPSARLLAENWDWHPRADEFSVVLEISQPGKPTLLTLTEAGILGKIGLNTKGLGVCLNILFAEISAGGVPVHFLLRRIMESENAVSAREMILRTPRSTASNLMFGDSSGAFFDLELKGVSAIEPKFPHDCLLHANHYLDEEREAERTNPNSFHRSMRGRTLYAELPASTAPREAVQRLLSDRGHEAHPICRPTQMGLHFPVATIASVLLDLALQEMTVCRRLQEPHWTTYPLGNK